MSTFMSHDDGHSAMSTRVVRFNPVVSQLSYKYGDEKDDQVDKNRHKNYMKNGTNASPESHLLISYQSPVEKVLVTINNNSDNSLKRNVPPGSTTQMSVGVVDPPEHNLKTNYPDLLAATPIFERKQQAKVFRQSLKLGITGNSNKNEKIITDALENDFLNANSKICCYNQDQSNYQEQSTPTQDEKGNKAGNKSSSWASSLMQQLTFLKKLVNKNSQKSEQQTNSRDLLNMEGISSRGRRQQQRSVALDKSHENIHSQKLESKSALPMHDDEMNPQKTLKQEPEFVEPPPRPHPRISKSRPSAFETFSYKKCIDMNDSNFDDELSLNFERILEQVDIMEKNPETIIGRTPPSFETKEDEITALVNECCAVSAALASLTISSSDNSCSQMPKAEGMKMPPTPKKEQGSEIERKRPPIPPLHKSKYLNSVLRDQFFRSSNIEPHPSHPLRTNKRDPLKGRGECKTIQKLDNKLSEFKESLHLSREELCSRMHPNFEKIEHNVESQFLRSSRPIDRFGRNPSKTGSNTGWETCSLFSDCSYSSKDHHHSSGYDDKRLNKEWNNIVANARKKLVVSSSFNNDEGKILNKKGILETDLDTGASREFFTDDFWHPPLQNHDDTPKVVKKTCKNFKSSSTLVQRNTCSSMQNLNLETTSSSLSPSISTAKEDRSRSMEFLLDEEKQSQLMPPENTLRKNQERQVSEHELRIQRSLQRLNVPDWFKKHSTPTTPVKSEKEFGSSSGLAGGWAGLSSSKTSSLTSLHSAGRYPGSKTQFSSTRYKGTGAGRSSKESLMSPSSTASASPSPYFERSSFTYGMPYALTRFASSRMSCGASPASLSPSPSPVGGITSSTSTPVSSGPMSRYGYNKTPYLGWRSQERLTSKSLYRSPVTERLAADLLAQKQQKATTPVSTTGSEISIVTSPTDRKETCSDLSLNVSDTSESSNKLNRVRSSIKEVSNAIVDYVNETKPLDDSINGRASPRRGLIWLESSFVGTKPIDSPGTPPSLIMSKHLGAQSQNYLASKRSSMKLDHNGDNTKDASVNASKSSSYSPAPNSAYVSRNEQMGERSSSSVSMSSPTLDDILDSLLALRRPQKKFRDKGRKEPSPSGITENMSATGGTTNTYESDWQERMNKPLDDSAYFPTDPLPPYFPPTTSNNKEEEDANERASFIPAFEERTIRTGSESSLDGARSQKPLVMDSQLVDQEDTRNEDDVAQEESNFGIPTEIHSTTLINNPLASLNEINSNPTTPARLRRVSFDLDPASDEKSSSRSKPRDESVVGVIHCKNPKCEKSASGLEARRDYKTCHNCNAYYCTRECRRLHWEKHKKVCMQSRVGQLCKQIITHVKEDSFVVSHLSTIAKRGYLAKGRGCVKLFFSSPDRAERFLTGGYPELPEPWYIPQTDMLPEEMGATIFSELSETCRSYNPETRFVVYATVCVVNEVPTSGAVKWEREMISRSAKVRLLVPRTFDDNQPQHHAPAIPAHHLNPQDIEPYGGNGSCHIQSESETLILRSVPTPFSLKQDVNDYKRRREISFANIQKHLVLRGVDLRRTYPDIYSKLCNYVENDEPFLPVTIYPKNSETGNHFMCVIMPESSDFPFGLSSTPDPSRNIEAINISEQ